MSVLIKFHAGLKNMCNHQFLFYAGMKEKNVCIMSRMYDSQSVFVIWLLFYHGDDMKIFHWFVYFLVRSRETSKKMVSKKKVSTLFLFFHSLKVFFWKIGRLARILWNRVLIMLFRGKEFRKRLAATETAAEIDEDCFQQDHWDTDDDDVPYLSPSVAPQNVTCPPSKQQKTKDRQRKAISMDHRYGRGAHSVSCWTEVPLRI